MNIEYHKCWSDQLQRDMELKVYGHAGKPALVFPALGGRFYDYENFGMVGACQSFIEAGKIQLYTVDSTDNQCWADWNAHPADRARQHEAFEQYILKEVVPFVHAHNNTRDKLLTTGCSMGGYHAANFFFRHPHIFDAVIALSGILRLNMFIGDYMDESIYYHSPLAYLSNLTDPYYLELYRQSKIIVCCGQGAWEDLMLEDARMLKRILEEKGIPARVDFWGHDVNHDWPWWQKMIVYFLGQLEL